MIPPRFLRTAAFAAAVAAATLAVHGMVGAVGAAREERRQLKEREAAWMELRRQVGVEIGSFKGDAGIVIKDLTTGWELSHQKERLFAAASLSKVPLMAACLVAADEGRIGLGRTIALRTSDKLSGSGTLKDLPAGTPFTVEKLIGLMIYESDNTATHMLTNLFGLDALNAAFSGFGLQHTRLSRKIADYGARDRGLENYTTAGDMALILEKIYRKQLGSPFVSEQSVNTLKLTRTNDRIPRYLPAELTIAHKTGLENGICHDAGIVYTRKGDLIVAVLTGHGNPDSVPSKDFIANVALLAHRYIDQL